jgi:hypothetical protein
MRNIVLLTAITLACVAPSAHTRDFSSSAAPRKLVSPVPMPEPSSFPLLAVELLAVGGLVFMFTRKKKN